MPVTITLDTLRPTISVGDAGSTISGRVFDGSSMAEVAISLDGGTTYQLATLNGNNWHSINRRGPEAHRSRLLWSAHAMCKAMNRK